jgi:predicted metal-dependent phosphoesterase TrpH
MTDERRVDFHTHSVASDGRLTPSDLVRYAREQGLSALGLTDHDTTKGLDEAEAVAREIGLIVVPGVELSSTVGANEAHLLGYFIDRENEEFQTALDDFVSQRSERVDRMIRRLREIGIDVDRDRVLANAGLGSIGRPAIGWALIEMGLASDMADAFNKYLGMGRPGYVPRPKLSPEDAIAIIRKAGGAPVLAHPLSTGDAPGIAKRLQAAGLVGFETWYGEYSPDQREQLHDIARANDLIPTGGSDFHALGFKEGRDLGSVPGIPWETIDRLYDASERIRQA